ncbi:MAG: DNA-directed RNA polymerase subunit omega [Proteobacteria bacterium]|nr:DNA-directed RNA polymerase subunit omega [Pseudomonadota bacterium]
MSRFTAEDCFGGDFLVTDRFKLVVLAAQRAKILARGHKSTIEEEKEGVKIKSKPSVVALQEIAAGHLSKAVLEEIAINSFALQNPFKKDNHQKSESTENDAAL